MNFRHALLAAALVFAPVFAGCAAPTEAEEPSSESSESELTNASIAGSITKGFEFFTGAKEDRTTEMASSTLPRAVRTAVANQRRAIFAKLAEEDLSGSVDTMQVYAVYTSSTKKTLAGYALWMHANNDSMGHAYLVGFNSRAAVVVEKNDWYQDDGDWE